MKFIKVLLIALGLLTVILTFSLADDKLSDQNWYSVAITEPNLYTFIGTSTLKESELAAIVSKGEGFIKMENLLYRDNNGKYKDWREWDPTGKSYIYINIKNVVWIHPLIGDPRNVSDKK
jgi:hypothetical protein